MNFIDQSIQEYSEQHTSPQSHLLNKIERDTYANVILPRMLSGHLQGRILSMFSNILLPRYILEIGTYTGYSALCLAEGLAINGQLITIDINEELEHRTQEFFNQSPYKENINFRIGNALDIIPTLVDNIDLVFIDADKENYINYFQLIINKVKKGGIIIVDNVLWSGKVTQPIQQGDKETSALISFNNAIQKDDRVDNVLFPVRDGLMVIRKL